MSVVAEAEAAFAAAFGGAPDGSWRAPGRANLIGEHTDYCGGLAITFAIDRATVVAARIRPDGRVRAVSTARGGDRPREWELDALRPGTIDSWIAYPFGVLWAARSAGIDVPGLDLAVASDVPVGSGLSSSAALELAVAAAVVDLAGVTRDPAALAAIGQRAENDFVGAPTGPMDQLTVAFAAADHGLRIDFGRLDVTPVPFDLGPLVVVDTGVAHRNRNGAYGARRRSCEAAAAALGLGALGEVPAGPEATAAALARLPAELVHPARHVLTENDRVRAATALLSAPPVDRAGIGALVDASHRSLRDDFEVSWAEADAVVDAVRGLGAAGARMIGAGFGGCCLVLGLPADRVRAAVAADVPGARVLPVRPAGGPERVG